MRREEREGMREVRTGGDAYRTGPEAKETKRRGRGKLTESEQSVGDTSGDVGERMRTSTRWDEMEDREKKGRRGGPRHYNTYNHEEMREKPERKKREKESI